MRIQVGGLSEGVHPFRFHVLPSEVGLPTEFAEEIGVEGTVEKTNGQFLLSAEITASADLLCDRCLAPMRTPIAPRYRMWYVLEGGNTPRVDPAELQVIPAGLTVIELDEDVRQTILLSVPLKHVCREDCRGLCPRCGKNLNEGPCGCVDTTPDSRWQGLSALHNDTMKDPR
jgi:uncharacterized protein